VEATGERDTSRDSSTGDANVHADSAPIEPTDKVDTVQDPVEEPAHGDAGTDAGEPRGPGGTDPWTVQFGGADAEFASAVNVDPEGNVVVAGSTFGALPEQTNAGGVDVFVRKLDANGNELWTKQFGTNEDDFCEALRVDPSGNLLVVGRTEGVFPGQSGMGAMDAFVIKLDADGNDQWTREFGSLSPIDAAASVDVDEEGNVFVAGSTGDALPGQSNLGGSDAFLRKLDADGSELWTRQFGSSEGDTGHSVRVDTNGHVLVAGSTFGSLAGQVSSGGGDAFVFAFDSDGEELWTRQFGSSGHDYGYAVGLDGSGKVFVAGATGNTLPEQNSAGSTDAFVLALDSNGGDTWVRQFGSSEVDVAHAVEVDAEGNVFVVGETLDELVSPPSALGSSISLALDSSGDPATMIELGSDSLSFVVVGPELGREDAFVRKLDPDGNELWTQQFGVDDSTESASAVAVDLHGNVFVAGGTTTALPGLTGAGGHDVFVMRLAP
jgi:hypothetical protein